MTRSKATEFGSWRLMLTATWILAVSGIDASAQTTPFTQDQIDLRANPMCDHRFYYVNEANFEQEVIRGGRVTSKYLQDWVDTYDHCVQFPFFRKNIATAQRQGSEQSVLQIITGVDKRAEQVIASLKEREEANASQAKEFTARRQAAQEARKNQIKEEHEAAQVRAAKLQRAIDDVSVLPAEDSSVVTLEQMRKSSEFVDDARFRAAMSGKLTAIRKSDLQASIISPKDKVCQNPDLINALKAVAAEHNLKVMEVYDQKSHAARWLDYAASSPDGVANEEMKADNDCVGRMLTSEGESIVQYGIHTVNGHDYLSMKWQ
jgi:hypothetical protein